MATVTLSAGPIDYDDTGGTGPVVVFGHGLLMNGSQWRKVIPRLDGFRCITPVLPFGAHRKPMRPDADLTQRGVARILADLFAALDLHDVTLVLNDWGGGQFVVSDGRADRVARLVLASCESYDNFPPKPARPAALLCRVPGGTALFAQLTRTTLFRRSRQAYGGLSKNRIPEQVLDDWFGPAVESAEIRHDLRKFVTGSPSKAVLDSWHDDVVRFPRPVLLLWATHDPMMPIAHARQMVGEFPDARLVEVDDSWTLIPEDQPEVFARELSKFVTTTGTTR
ncbi:alpha/beta fold hydrolase [Gordonia zhaorongruii]|uniref:alpha/beta fold hydrolase n=1 Tax=Gordonia zhaorongruii TaxID=2597659 RepID=UPI00104A5FB7|nr:alpha/beta hydrolase [Gordonia zhaorongruii]